MGIKRTPSALLMAVTPEMALEWLTAPAFRGPNRHLGQEWVNELARRMKAGHWRVTGESIKFGVTGELLDGQHRLHAVAASGVTIKTYVIYGVENDAQDVMDSGRKRTAADALSIRQIPNYSAVAAAAKVLIRAERGEPESHAVVPSDEVVKFVEDHPRLIEAGGHFVGTRIGMAPSTWLGAMYLAYSQHPEEALAFDAACKSGAGLTNGDPVLALRERAMQIKMNHERHSPWAMISLTLRCFDAWLKHRKLAKVPMYRGGELVPPPPGYPIPAE